MTTRLKILYHLLVAMLFLVMLFLHHAGNGMANGKNANGREEKEGFSTRMVSKGVLR